MSKFTLLTVLIFLIISSTIFAQSQYKSPYKEPSWALDGGSILGAFGFAAIDKATADNVKTLLLAEVNNLSRDDLNAFDRNATYQNSKFARNNTGIVTMASFAVPAFLFTSSKVRSDWRSFSLMYLETFALTGAITNVAKNVVQRTRPYVYNPDYPLYGYDDLDFDDKVDNQDANKSFFSSDVSLSFSLATMTSIVYSDYYPDSKLKPYVWGGTMAYATFVAYLRYASGWHFPTDIISGALVGSAIGWLVPYLHRNADVSIGASYQQDINVHKIYFTFGF
jgi:membrane-associated phospholipid phosphatase